MPKRKRNHDAREDYDHLNRKLRRLERKLRRRRSRSPSRSRRRRHHRRPRTPSSYSESSSREASPSPRIRTDEHEYEHSSVSSPSPVDDSILGELMELDSHHNAAAPDSAAPDSAAPDYAALGPTPAPESAPPESALQTLAPPSAADMLVDTELLEILGEDPTSKPEFGNEFHKELTSRLEHIATSGLSKDTRKELFEKYLVPSNCMRIAAPLLNPEIKAAIPDLTLKRDKGIEARQRQLASAITCIGQAITSEMLSKDKNNLLLKQLMDAVRMLCDIQHADSMKRRYFACSSLKKDINDQLQPTKIDKFLFGENLAETLKAAKAVSKSGAEIKVDTHGTHKNFKKSAQPPPSTSKNWRPPPARRPPPATTGIPRTRQRAPARKPEISSRTSRHPSKQTRRQ